MINLRMQERRYGVTEERGRGRSMEPDRNQLTLVTQTSWNGCPSRRASAGRLPLTSNLSRSRTRKRNSTFAKRVCLFIRLELWAQALSGINQRQTLILVRKSTLEHYDFNRRDCFRAQTPLNWTDKPATVAGDRRNRYDGMK